MGLYIVFEDDFMHSAFKIGKNSEDKFKMNPPDDEFLRDTYNIYITSVAKLSCLNFKENTMLAVVHGNTIKSVAEYVFHRSN